METSLTMLASAEASAAASRAVVACGASTPGLAVMASILSGHGAGVLPVHGEIGEPEAAVGAQCRRVVAVDVEVDGAEAASGEVGQPEGREGPAEAPPLLVGVHPHDVDLSGPARVTGFDLGPVEGDGAAVALDEEEAGRVEPGLLHPFVQVGDREAALLRMVRERRRVEGHPRLLVAPGLEGPHRV